MPFALQVKTPEDIKFVTQLAKLYNLNLDYIKDNVEYNAEDGEDTIVILDGIATGHVTFTDRTRSGFEGDWKFVADAYDPTLFSPIERV